MIYKNLCYAVSTIEYEYWDLKLKKEINDMVDNRRIIHTLRISLFASITIFSQSYRIHEVFPKKKNVHKIHDENFLLKSLYSIKLS